IGRGSEDEQLTQRLGIERSARCQFRETEEGRHGIGIVGWQTDDLHVALPVILRHVLRGLGAVAAVRIIKVQENVAFVQVERLSVHGNGLRYLDTALMSSVIRQTGSREYYRRCEQSRWNSQLERWLLGPPHRQQCNCHESRVFREKPRIH